MPEVELVACCDARAAAAESFAAEFECEGCYSSLEEMLSRRRLDGVILGTWPPHHREHIEACIDAGIRAILCEKSLTTSVEDAVAIHTAVRASGALLVEAFMYRHDPTVRRFFEMINRGEIGKLDSIRAEFTLFDPEEKLPEANRDWRQREDLGGGVPFDFVPYCVNACNHAAGALPERVTALSFRSSDYGTVNRHYGLIEYRNGVVGTVSTSRKGNFGFETRATGSDGSLMLSRPWAPSGIPGEQVPERDVSELFHSRGLEGLRWETETIEIAAVDHYAVQLEHFAESVRGEREPEPSLAESVLNVATINALLESADEGAWVPVMLPEQISDELLAGNVRR